MLIAAASGRALAASARRGGFAPLVADRFGDLDTLAAAQKHVFADLARPIDGNRLMAALDTLDDGGGVIGVVCGTGFEDRADLLTRLAARWPLLGTDPATVAALKDPIAFARLCAEAEAPHPQTSLSPPAQGEGWLVKRMGGAGGWHIRAAGDGESGEGVYYQRRVVGRPVSAQLLGNGARIMVLGFSEQWTAPTARHPYRYGGALRPVALDAPMRMAMEAAVARLCQRLPLRGLGSADFLVDGERFQLLEINPRPGATLDLFEPDAGSLFALHVAACSGRLPECAPRLDGAMAGAIVYAERTIAAMPALVWPDWIAERPAPESRIEKDQPLCSVFARADTAAAARRLLEERCARVHALMAEVA